MCSLVYLVNFCQLKKVKAHSSIDHNTKAMFDDGTMALMEVNSGVVAMGLYTSCVVLMDENLELLKNSTGFI